MPGHERCAIAAAALHAQRRAERLRDAEPTPETLAIALDQLGERSLKRKRRKRRDRQPGRRVLTRDQIQMVRDLYGVNGGEVGLVTMRQLAELFGTTATTIHRIIHGHPRRDPQSPDTRADPAASRTAETRPIVVAHRRQQPPTLPPAAPIREIKDPAA